MRRVGLLLILLMAIPAQAEVLMEDDRGDHEFRIADAAGDASQMPALDLLSIDLVESKDAFTFTLAVAELDPQQVEPTFFNNGVEYGIHFTYGGVDYRAAMYRFATSLDGSMNVFGRFQVHDPGRDQYVNLEALDVQVDLKEDLMTVAIDRDLVLARDGSPPRIGTALEQFYATSEVDFRVDFFGLGAPPVYEGGDQMPDDGVSSYVWDIQYGLEQTGHARLWSDQPVRTSNGEATTFLYTVNAENRAGEDDTFRLSASGAPDTWDVDFPDARIKIPAGDDIDVPVLITVPFNHQHGKYVPVLVELTSETDPEAVGRLELGVRYTSIPQPAGHHDKLFLHRGQDNQFFGGVIEDADKYFNTIEDDELSTPGDLPRTRPECAGTTLTHIFDFPLAPSLEMGLDFDLTRTGLLDMTVASETPMTGVAVQGELLYGLLATDTNGRGNTFERVQYTPLATVERVTLGDIANGGQAGVETVITPLPAGDYIPFEDGASLLLRLEVEETLVGPPGGFCFAMQKQPVIKPGGSFTLPLEDYHDVIDSSFSIATGLDLAVETSKRYVNPGMGALFEITAVNEGNLTDYTLQLTGTNVEWATLLQEHLQIATDETVRFPVTVLVPDTARDGMTADLNLIATSIQDPNMRSILRLVVEVDTDADYPDDTEAIQALTPPPAEKQSPGLSPLLLLAIFLRRR